MTVPLAVGVRSSSPIPRVGPLCALLLWDKWSSVTPCDVACTHWPMCWLESPMSRQDGWPVTPPPRWLLLCQKYFCNSLLAGSFTLVSSVWGEGPFGQFWVLPSLTDTHRSYSHFPIVSAVVIEAFLSRAKNVTTITTFKRQKTYSYIWEDRGRLNMKVPTIINLWSSGLTACYAICIFILVPTGHLKTVFMTGEGYL